jgi:hypothetical protein
MGGTLEVLQELAKVPERSALSIVATYRNDERARLHRLRSARSELRRAGRSHEIVFQPMSREQTYRLMEGVAGSSLSEGARQRICSGIPWVTSASSSASYIGRLVTLCTTLAMTPEARVIVDAGDDRDPDAVARRCRSQSETEVPDFHTLVAQRSVPPAGFERKGCTSALTLAATYVLT